MGAVLVIDYDYYRTYSRATMGGGALVTSTAAGGAVVKSTSAGGAVVKSTSSGGGSTQTSSSGGGSNQTSSSGGGVAKSTAAGGGSTQASSSAAPHRHRVFGYSGNYGSEPAPGDYQMFHAPRASDGSAAGLLLIAGASGDVYTQSADGAHSHTVPIQTHTHNFEIPNHTHSVTIPNHTHSVTIPNHTHEIDIPSHSHQIDIPDHQHDISIPDHTHGIDYGIFKISQMPTKVEIKVDGKAIPHTSLSGDSIDLIPYLALDSEKRVQRGWHTVEITPNERARINAQLMVQFFMQSRGGVDA